MEHYISGDIGGFIVDNGVMYNSSSDVYPSNPDMNAYLLASTQFTASESDVVASKVTYSKNGVIVGNLSSEVSDSFADSNAKIVFQIQQQYNNMTPKVLTSSSSFDKQLFFIPAKLDGTPLWDTSNLTSMEYLFDGCSNLMSIPSLNTSNVTNMGATFRDCSSLVTIPLLDTSKVTSFASMFSSCVNLVSIPLLNTSRATTMVYMFWNCQNLISIPLLNTSAVTNMQKMFNGCSLLSNETLNNILAMCANSVVTSNKTLKYIGLTSAQATICQSLSNYQAFINAGWTTGY